MTCVCFPADHTKDDHYKMPGGAVVVTLQCGSGRTSYVGGDATQVVPKAVKSCVIPWPDIIFDQIFGSYIAQANLIIVNKMCCVYMHYVPNIMFDSSHSAH